VQQLRADGRVERGGALLHQPQTEVHVPEQPSLLRRQEEGRGAELDRAPDVVEERGRQQEVAAQAWMELGGLAAERRHADGVLQQPAGVGVVAVDGGGQVPEPGAEGRVADEPGDGRAQAGVRQLVGEELEEAVQLVGVASERRRERRGIGVGCGLEGSHLELEPVAEPLDPSEHADGVPCREAGVEQLDVLPHPRLDPPAPVGELEREVGRPASCAQPLLARHRVDPLDDPILRHLRDRRDGGHDRSLGPRTDARVEVEMAVVKPFRALRYDVSKTGPLEALVAPPYDVIDDAARAELLARSPYNVVHLTLPDDEEHAARDLAAWRSEGALVEESPTAWILSQDYVGPDGVARRRTGVVASLRVEPYDRRVVLPHERTHSGPKEGRLRLLRATRTQLEPIFLLHDGPRVAPPDCPPDLEVEGTRLWRADTSVLEGFDDRELLIADGHHRYETALAYHAEQATEASAWMMVVLVSTADEGLTIFPTHRLVGTLPPELTDHGGDEAVGIEDALAELGRVRGPAYAVYDGDFRVYAPGNGDESTVEHVHRFDLGDVSYTADPREAVARVDAGEARAALLVAPTPIERVFAVARRGEVMPQKTTYFFPKLVSGLLFHPLD
jgi:uncharacterized protein (DUF1015 family)